MFSCGFSSGAYAGSVRVLTLLGQRQAPAWLMPSGAVDNDDGMGAGCHGLADLGQMQGHGLFVGERHDEGGAGAAGRADSAEDVGPAVSAVARSGWSATLFRPDVGQRALLADPGFVLPPEFDRLAASVLGNRGGDQGGEVFLCASIAATS